MSELSRRPVYKIAVTADQLAWVLDKCPQARYMDNHVPGHELKHIVYTSCAEEAALFSLRWGQLLMEYPYTYTISAQ